MSESVFTVRVFEWSLFKDSTKPYYTGDIEFDIIENNNNHPEADEHINNFQNEIAVFIFENKLKCPVNLRVTMKEWSSYDDYSGAYEGDSMLTNIEVSNLKTKLAEKEGNQ